MISIYKLTVDGDSQCYIGSTKRDPEERLLEHARPGNKCASRALFKLGKVHMEVIAQCDPNERDRIEKYHILNTPGTVNKCLPGDFVFKFKSPRRRAVPIKPPSSPTSPESSSESLT